MQVGNRLTHGKGGLVRSSGRLKITGNMSAALLGRAVQVCITYMAG